MAGRFLPQKDVNLITRVSRELVGDKQRNKDGLINQECVVYKPSLQESAVNMYGEAAGGKKVYKDGVQMNALVEADDFDFNTDEFGPDTTQAVTFAFQRANLIDINLKPDIGDVINWNYAYFEINSINENMLIGGDVNKNFDLVCTTHLTRLSRVNLVERSK